MKPTPSGRFSAVTAHISDLHWWCLPSRPSRPSFEALLQMVRFTLLSAEALQGVPSVGRRRRVWLEIINTSCRSSRFVSSKRTCFIHLRWKVDWIQAAWTWFSQKMRGQEMTPQHSQHPELVQFNYRSSPHRLLTHEGPFSACAGLGSREGGEINASGTIR